MTNPSSLTGKKVLWLEDDKFLSDIIAQKLAHENVKLLYANNGEAAIEMAMKDSPDIILLDILLSGMNGLEVLKRLKSLPKTKDIPVIMFSNLDDKMKIDESMKLGAKSFFIKASVDLDQIIEEIIKALPKTTE